MGDQQSYTRDRPGFRKNSGRAIIVIVDALLGRELLSCNGNIQLLLHIIVYASLFAFF